MLALALTLPAHGTRAADHAVILQYHHVSDTTPRSTSVTLDELRGHLDHLDVNGFTVRPVTEILAALRAGRPLADRTVGLTFDDGYANFLDGAADLLESRGASCTIFLPTAAIQNAHGGYLDWDEIRALRDRGFEFASHGHAHIHMAAPEDGESVADWRERVSVDIDRSLLLLRAELGEVPPLFVYPYGEYSEALMKIVAGFGLTAFAQMSGPVWAGSDTLALPRFPASGPYADLKTLRAKLLSLPLPLRSIDPVEPVITDPRPTLRLQLEPGNHRLRELAAYASGQGRVPVVWIDEENLIFEVAAPAPLPAGRSRFNITMPDRSGGRYMWYSHPWFFGRSADEE